MNKPLNGRLRHWPISLSTRLALFLHTIEFHLITIFRYLQVHTVVPSDGGVLQKLGETFDRLGDRQQAFQYYSDVIQIINSIYFTTNDN